MKNRVRMARQLPRKAQEDEGEPFDWLGLIQFITALFSFLRIFFNFLPA